MPRQERLLFMKLILEKLLHTQGNYSEKIYESKKDFLQENCFYALTLVDT